MQAALYPTKRADTEWNDYFKSPLNHPVLFPTVARLLSWAQSPTKKIANYQLKLFLKSSWDGERPDHYFEEAHNMRYLFTPSQRIWGEMPAPGSMDLLQYKQGMRKKMLKKENRARVLSTKTVRDIKQSLVALLQNCALAQELLHSTVERYNCWSKKKKKKELTYSGAITD